MHHVVLGRISPQRRKKDGMTSWWSQARRVDIPKNRSAIVKHSRFVLGEVKVSSRVCLTTPEQGVFDHVRSDLALRGEWLTGC